MVVGGEEGRRFRSIIHVGLIRENLFLTLRYEILLKNVKIWGAGAKI